MRVEDMATDLQRKDYKIISRNTISNLIIYYLEYSSGL